MPNYRIILSEAECRLAKRILMEKARSIKQYNDEFLRITEIVSCFEFAVIDNTTPKSNSKSK